MPDSFSSLLEDHAGIAMKLRNLESTLDEMMEARAASEAIRLVLDDTIRFFEEELLQHFRAEEDIVLPPLEAKIGRFGTLVNVIAYEHEEIRREIAKFKDARAEMDRARDPWPAIEELNRHGIFTVQFLADHLRKERSSLFPTALAELSREDLDRIRERLRR